MVQGKRGIPPQENHRDQRRWVLWGANTIWVFALMLYVLVGTAAVPFHGDESTIIMMSRDYHYQFIAGDWEQVFYHDPPLNETEQHLRLINGTVSKYLIGFNWHLNGFTVDDLNEQWLWGAGWAWNVANGHMPSDALLFAARQPAAWLTALSVALMFGAAWLWRGAWAAYPASLLLAIHPVILLNGRRAIFEAALLCFGLLVVFIAAYWLRRASGWVTAGDRRIRRVAWGLASALGAAGGLTIASKHSGAVLVAAVFLAMLIVFWRGSGAVRWPRIGLLAVGGIVVIGVFLLLNPAWWSDPVGRFFEVVRLRGGLVTEQAALFPEAAYPDFWARVGGLAAQLTAPPLVYYEVDTWAEYLGEAAAAYEALPWTGLRYGANALTTLAGLGVFGLALVGIWRLLHFIRAGDGIALAVGLWGLFTLGFTLLTIPLNWQRYYMPLYPVEVLLAAVGFAWSVPRLIQRLRSRPVAASLQHD